MNFSKEFQERSPGFQMAPMVDVVFLLLIFFMVASVWAQWETKIGIKLPYAGSGDQKPRARGEIIVNLDADGRIFVNEVEQSHDQLGNLLALIAQSTEGEQPVIIRADRKTDYESVVTVLDICRQRAIYNVSFATLGEQRETPAE